MAIFSYNYSALEAAPGLYVEDIFVRPQFRDAGYMRLLMERLLLETRTIGATRLEWSAFKWNKAIMKYYESSAIGAKRVDEWINYRVAGEVLEKHWKNMGLARAAKGEIPNGSALTLKQNVSSL